MSKSIEEQAKEYQADETRTKFGPANSFLAGAKARDAQWVAVVNELRDTINWCQDQCGYASPWWVKFNETKTKADQMLKEMGIK